MSGFSLTCYGTDYRTECLRKRYLVFNSKCLCTIPYRTFLWYWSVDSFLERSVLTCYGTDYRTECLRKRYLVFNSKCLCTIPYRTFLWYWSVDSFLERSVSVKSGKHRWTFLLNAHIRKIVLDPLEFVLTGTVFVTRTTYEYEVPYT